MQILLGIVTIILIGYLLWFVGHLIKDFIELNEENNILRILIELSLGAVAFFILVNLIGNITGSFNMALIGYGLITGLAIYKNFSSFKTISINIYEGIKSKSLIEQIKQSTNKYFWILLGLTNLIYTLTAFITIKMYRYGIENSHTANINQLLNNIYPIRYESLKEQAFRGSYGIDILGALISKISGNVPEVSLDLLSIFLLNIAFFTLYSLTVRFINKNEINKYLVPFAAFLAWGPILGIFDKSTDSRSKLFQNLYNLTETKLVDKAYWTGTTIHYFFNPQLALSVFFFLIFIYFAYKVIVKQDKDVSSIFLGIFLSSFVIIDFSKLIIFTFALILLLGIKLFQANFSLNDETKENIKQFATIIGIGIGLGLTYGNSLIFGKNFTPLTNIFHIGKSSFQAGIDPLSTNIILWAIYGYGFYLANKEKDSWTNFILLIFVSSLIIPYIISIPMLGGNDYLFTANIVGAFALPIAVNHIAQKCNFGKNLNLYYSSIFITFSFCTLLVWAFGDRPNSIFTLTDKSIKLSRFQEVESKINDYKAEILKFVNAAKSSKGKTILIEKDLSLPFIEKTNLAVTYEESNSQNIYLKKNEGPIDEDANYQKAISLNKEYLKKKNTSLIFLSQRFYRYIMNPQARIKLLDLYLNKGLKSIYSSSKYLTEPDIKELYEIKPNLINKFISKDFYSNIEKTINSKEYKENKLPYFISKIIKCPYNALYSTMSNDFNGDKFADIAFYNPEKRTWNIIDITNLKANTINLNKRLLSGIDQSNTLIPVPGDYDGDQITDIALINRTTGNWHIIKSSNKQIDPKAQYIIWCKPTGEIVIPSDFDGDLITDYSCLSSVHILGGWHTHQSSDSMFVAFNAGFSAINTAVNVDLDGDNKADHVTYDSNKQKFSGYLSSNNFDQSKYLQVNLGTNSSIVVPADYDGDKKVDLAVWIPETGEWNIAYSANTLSTNILSDGNSGKMLGCGVPAPKGDTAIPKCSIETFKLGKTGDIPMPGDYNGDGKDDIAILHTDTFIFEILKEDGSNKKVKLDRFRGSIPASLIGV